MKITSTINKSNYVYTIYLCNGTSYQKHISLRFSVFPWKSLKLSSQYFEIQFLCFTETNGQFFTETFSIFSVITHLAVMINDINVQFSTQTHFDWDTKRKRMCALLFWSILRTLCQPFLYIFQYEKPVGSKHSFSTRKFQKSFLKSNFI